MSSSNVFRSLCRGLLPVLLLLISPTALAFPWSYSFDSDLTAFGGNDGWGPSRNRPIEPRASRRPADKAR